MRNIKLILEYDGTDFSGWQVQATPANGRQSKNKARRTIAGEIEKALKIIFGKDIHLIGSGRTDSGVHARAQVANFNIDSSMIIERIHGALNAHLPDDISVVGVEEVNAQFHAQYNARLKTYRYTILNRKTRSPLYQRTALFYPYPLNLSRMRAQAQSIIGRHDFKSFQAANPSRLENATTVRVVNKIKIQRKGDLIFIDIEANGFLYKMVRNIVGTLLEIGSSLRNRLPPGGVKMILAKKDRNLAGNTALAHGLMLMEVKY